MLPVTPDSFTGHQTSKTTQSNSCALYNKTALIRDQVLRTIRVSIPLTIVFTPELKINLDLFIKDQILIHTIAESISPLVGKGPMDCALIEKHFDNSELMTELKSLFKPLFLTSLFKACADVVNGRPSEKHIEQALQGRIFTMNNALIAQHNPKAIHMSQIKNGISPQDLSTIQATGAGFIRDMLNLHMQSLQSGDASFRKDLKRCIDQLVKFTQTITRFYLEEFAKDCPPNPLTFRDPTGHNYHGRAAATVLEACLNALGLKTRLLLRSDLEPKVNLAPVHSIIEVMSPDGIRYLVDPTYIQFHKDVCLDESLLPSAPVLILEESEVDTYIEENILAEWKKNLIEVSLDNTFVVNKLQKKDRILSYIIHKVKIPSEIQPSSPEDWVRKSFKRVWDLSTYLPITANQGFHEIFYGTEAAHRTYDLIQAMGIAPLTTYPSWQEIEARLNELMSDPTLKGQNSAEALSLIVQLPRERRESYTPLLDVDTRLKGKLAVDMCLNAYFRSLKKIVNPLEQDLSVVYGCSGSDCTSVLLATDAVDFTFVDLTPISYADFKSALCRVREQDTFTLAQLLPKDDNFISYRLRFVGGMSRYLGNGKHEMLDLATKFFIELKEIGVDLSTTHLTPIDNGVQVDFSWCYQGSDLPRARRITYVNADMTQPNLYPLHLKTTLLEGFDIYYMKGAFFVPQAYPQFLPQLAQSMRTGGWLMTVDKTCNMEEMSPETCLQQDGLVFEHHKGDAVQLFKELTIPPYDPLASVALIDFNPSFQQRPNRTPGTDISYWSLLNLRQKKANR